jgi:hypothetical protein
MIKNEFIKITIQSKNRLYYESLLYKKLNIGDVVEILSENILRGSKILITGICDFCGNERKVSMKEYNNQTNRCISKFSCSKKCSILKSKEYNLEKYGVENVFQNNNIKEKIKEKKIELYGDSNFNNRIKSFDTNLEKYGYKYASSSPHIKEKVKKTNLYKFGCEFPSQSELVYDKIKKINIEKYGVDNYSKTEIFKEKITERWFKTMYFRLEKYGILKKVDDGYTIKCNKCDNDFKILNSLMNKRINNNEEICLNCNPIHQSISKLEKNVLEFIKDSFNGEIVENHRELKREIDIYLPELKLGFEFNGLYWHSELYKEPSYHLDKKNRFLESNVNLIHIWEDDWEYKQDIVKSMILNRLCKNPNKIYARKCQIKEVNDNKIVREFLETNHIQGFIGSKVKLGLYYNNELLSLMTFGNLRKSLGQNSKEGTFELLRFCNKLNTTVIGGASKLFKYFLTNYNPKEIISYSDFSRSNGNMYNQLGFSLSHLSKPNYYYIVDGVRNHRFNFRKDKLVKEGFDSSLTEIEIMNSRGFYRIFDCGMQKWIYSI